MKARKQIFILAGEPSGDKVGADLITRLTSKGDFDFIGVGGQKLQQAGIKSIYPMSDLSVMGFADVILRLPKLLFRNWQTARFILKQSPDLIVLIDSQVFSTMLAKRLRKAGYKRPIILYVAPAVWAWKPERAAKLVGVFDEILAVLPFEPKVMKKLNGPKTSYVGHPALSLIKSHARPKNKGLIALFPGSRAGEIKRHMPLFEHLVKALKNHKNITGFVLPTLPHLADNLRIQVRQWDVDVEIIVEQKQREQAMENTILSVVTAGTISLEQALGGVNMVGTYIPDKIMHKHYIKAGKPMIALPNIILSQQIVPEIYPPGERAQALIKASLEMLEDEEKRTSQSLAFAKMRLALENGEEEENKQDPENRVLAYLD